MALEDDVWRIARDAGLVKEWPGAKLGEWASKFAGEDHPQLAGHPVVQMLRQRITGLQARSYRWVRNADRAQAIERLLAKIPDDVTGVAGVPRSGIAPAAEIAMRLHLHLYAIGPAQDLTALNGGWRFSRSPGDRGALLVVDDTVCSGASFRRLEPRLRMTRRNRRVYTAVVYAAPDATRVVDFHGEVLPTPHLLEWNFGNSVYAPSMALDFDGVLCHDPPDHSYDDDGPKYAEFLETTKPLYPFRMVPIELIITGRIERYREQTLRWLKKHGMSCKRLVMAPFASAAERNRNNMGAWKASELLKTTFPMFVESDPEQAKTIASIAKRPVLCPTAGVFQ